MAAEKRGMREEARAALREHWGHEDFRPGQWETIEAVLAGRDAFAVLPTGGGKSLCYQVPALLREGLTLVVSPLIALMQDQVAGLRARGIPAAFINSTLSAREIDQRWTDAEFGKYRLLYVAPERFQSEMFEARGGRLKVNLLAVDEAHCVSEWGHNFRPAYLRLPDVRTFLGDPPILAVTATATPPVRRDVLELLGLRDPAVVIRGFDRPNLVWSLFRTENKREKVFRVIRNVPGSGILYAATRRSVETWAEWLREQGVTVGRYHGGLPQEERAHAQEAWRTGALRVMVTTNAFGMGIDKPDVRFVIHVDVPSSLEGYYQEAGRAGRDGERAYAVLLFHERDEATRRALIDSAHPTAKEVRAVYDAVCNLNQIAVAALPETPLALEFEAVQRLTGFARAKIATAVELLERQETWTVLPVRKGQGMIRFLQPADAIRRFAGARKQRALAAFVDDLLRSVNAQAFTEWRPVDVRLLEKRTRLERKRLMKGLAFLQERGLLAWRPPGAALHVQLNEHRAGRLPIDDAAVRRARRQAEARLADMLRYARSITCRRHFLLSYFGEPSPEHCGTCDVCLGRHRPKVVLPEDEPALRHLLGAVHERLPRARWFEGAPVPEHRLDGLLEWLVREGYLHTPDPLEERFLLTEKGEAYLARTESRASDV
ncbi:RecQ family ATP-dependent DNA helicase [Rhodocaloribacter sp.]